MSVQLDLPPEVENRLREAASRQGQETAEYLRTLVEQHLKQTALESLRHRVPPRSLADLQPAILPPPGRSWLEGVIGEWPGNESDEEIERLLNEMS